MASISRRGRFWRARIRMKGEIATKTFDTELEAENWAHKYEEKIRRGVLHKNRPSSIVQRLPLGPSSGYFRNPDIDENWLVERSKARKSLRMIPGVYFLLSGYTVVYVGKSENCPLRISLHCKGPMVFDSYHYIPFHIDEISEMERHYIDLFDPIYNIDNLTKSKRKALTSYIEIKTAA